MRRLLVAVGLLASMSNVFAGEFEMPVLRGSEGFAPAGSVYRWNGAYVGAHFGHSSAGVDFGGGVSDLASFIVRSTVLEPVVAGMTTTLRKADTNSNSFGGFAGYNFQFEDAVLGFEVSYSRTALSTAATDSISVIYSNDAGAPPGHHFVYDPLTVSGSAAIRITDLMTLRARAGWAAGQFLPYAFVGFAAARADVSRSATVFTIRRDLPDPGVTPIAPDTIGPLTRSETKDSGYYFGYTGGLGLEIAVFPSVFLRAEWEAIVLPNIQSMGVNINTLRAGIGMRF
jgi:outer membrane immunogenic protein